MKIPIIGYEIIKKLCIRNNKRYMRIYSKLGLKKAFNRYIMDTYRFDGYDGA